MRRSFATTTLLSVLLATSNQSSAAGTLTELYNLTLQNDPELQVAEQRARRAEAQTNAAFGKLLPQINASAQVSGTQYDSDIASYGYRGEKYNLSLSQVLIDFSLLSEVEQAEWEEETQRAVFDLAGQERVAVFVERYFETLRRRSLLELSRQELEVLNKSVEQVESLYQKQLVSKVDRLEVMARRVQVIAKISQQEAEFIVAQEMLAESVGDAAYNLSENIKLSPELGLIDIHTEEHWRELALSQSPDLIAGELRLKAAEAALERAENDRLPKLGLSLSSQYSNVGNSYAQTDFSTASVLSLNLSMPLYLGGSDQARIDAQEAQLAQTRSEVEMNRNRVLREVRTAFLSTRATLLSQEAAKAAVSAAETSRLAAEKSFKFGITDIVTLMERSAAEFSAQQQLTDVEFQLVTNYVNLLKSSGALTAEDIDELDRLIAG